MCKAIRNIHPERRRLKQTPPPHRNNRGYCVFELGTKQSPESESKSKSAIATFPNDNEVQFRPERS